MLSCLYGTTKIQTHYYEHQTLLSASFCLSDCGSYTAVPKGINKPSHCRGMLMAQEKCYLVLVLNELYILNIVR